MIKNTKPYIPKEDIDPILADIKLLLESGELSMGETIDQFEQVFAEYIKTDYAATVNSGTAALESCLRFYCRGKKNCEVIVPTNTFVATANAVIFAGATPVLTDLDETHLCADYDDIKRKMSERTAGIIVVHACGRIPDYIFELKEFCKNHNLFLIEDCAHAHGATIDNLKAGALGDAAAFSFFPTKLMTTGEGGMVTTNNKDLIDFVKQVRNHGQQNGLMTELGYNWRMSTINAVLGIHQLKRLDSFVQARNKIALRYQESLNGFAGLKTLDTPQNITHSYWKYPIITQNESRPLRDKLKARGINTGQIYYPPVHLHPYYIEKYGYKKGTLKKSESVLPRQMCLPMFVELTEEEQNYVIETVKNVL